MINCHKNILLIFLFSIFLFSCSSQEQTSGAIRIMPLGDSITQADTDHHSYRYPLWKLLKKGGYEIDFVGSMKTNYLGPNPTRSFDTDHEGHWGWRADHILKGARGQGNLLTVLTKNTPDIVLLHIGSNDIFNGEDVPKIITELKEIITIINSANSNSVILIAQIIPTGDTMINVRISKLNKAISHLAPEMGQLYSRLIVVNHHDGFNPIADTYDGVHPNKTGELKMAGKWYKALKSVLMKSHR